jgi:hypothetical protein
MRKVPTALASKLRYPRLEIGVRVDEELDAAVFVHGVLEAGEAGPNLLLLDIEAEIEESVREAEPDLDPRLVAVLELKVVVDREGRESPPDRGRPSDIEILSGPDDLVLRRHGPSGLLAGPGAGVEELLDRAGDGQLTVGFRLLGLG